MTTKTKREPKRCANCGKGHYRRIARAGRHEHYKGFRIELPADIPLVECDACHELILSLADMEKLEPVIEASYRAHLHQAAARAIDLLVKREHTVAAVERKLHLSTGYLSRLRNGSVDGGFPLVALLVLLAEQPTKLEEIDTLVLNAATS